MSDYYENEITWNNMKVDYDDPRVLSYSHARGNELSILSIYFAAFVC